MKQMLGKLIFGKRKIQRKMFEKEFNMWPDDYTNMDFTKDRLGKIKIYLKESLEHEDLETIDDVTWNDLNMDDMYFKLNHTRSFVGEQVLYKELATISSNPFVSEEHIAYLLANSEKRIDLEQAIYSIGKQKDDYYLPIIINDASALRIGVGWIYNILQQLLFVLLFVALVSQNRLFIMATIGIGVINLTISMYLKNKYQDMLFSIGSIKQMTSLVKLISNDKELSSVFLTDKLDSVIKTAEKISKYISNFQIRRKYYMIGDSGGLILDYIMGITLYDIVSYNRVIKLMESRRNDFLTLYKLIGQLDVEIAVASYRHRINNWCIPEFDSDIITVSELVHPAVNKCISNSIEIENGIMLTGANASGKSTFMKAIAVNAIISQTLNTASANRFVIPYNLMIMSSMSLRDDIETGESYYLREINQLKKMIESINETKPTLILIDEILKGTNSIERVAASYGVLEYLYHKNAFVVVATHDISLVELVKDRYKCYYFGSEIIDGEIKLDYKLHQGINSTSNAIKLLEITGFPQEIITLSMEQIKHMAV
ncbi:MAG: hypothetical protein E7263_09390 [Lachnospiraceae bacterium]|nr:hypothetical protein [Lachnospiraceae bacterium]